MMAFYFVLYIALMGIAGFWAGYHANDTDENDCFKVQWRLIIVFIMFLASPFVAKMCGLC